MNTDFKMGIFLISKRNFKKYGQQRENSGGAAGDEHSWRQQLSLSA
jgi:hypothetical protein